MPKLRKDDRPEALTRNRHAFRSEAKDWSERGPPAPAEILTNIGLLALVALCFALAAQLLVGTPAH
jgi:hypothetical protein